MKQSPEPQVQMIPIEKIRVINSRDRARVKHDQIKESIATVGLKKPIQVSRRSEGDTDGYDLVYGEGRIKAFMALGATEIPAIVVDLPKEERLLRSLVENMARRNRNPMALLREIQRLKELGYSNLAISKKIGVSDGFIGQLLKLVKAGEERLVTAALNGALPISVASFGFGHRSTSSLVARFSTVALPSLTSSGFTTAVTRSVSSRTPSFSIRECMVSGRSRTAPSRGSTRLQLSTVRWSGCTKQIPPCATELRIKPTAA